MVVHRGLDLVMRDAVLQSDGSWFRQWKLYVAIYPMYDLSVAVLMLASKSSSERTQPRFSYLNRNRTPSENTNQQKPFKISAE